MPFPFTLPTTSHLSVPTHVSSSTHASLPTSASSYRNVLRSALKTYKRFPPAEQPAYLTTVHSALETYIPFLFTLECGLNLRPVVNEDIQINLLLEIEVEWRPTLSSANIPGRDASRVKGQGLEYEIYSTLQTLATLHNLLARQQLLTLYSSTPPNAAARLTAIQTATKSLLTANSVHNYLLQRSQTSPVSFHLSAVDITPTIQSALSSLSLAEATLLFVLKDDPYPAIVQQSLSKTDKEWMIAAPSIHKVRAHLFARLCVCTSDHASHASASLVSDPKISSDLKTYCSDLAKTAKAKACRFLGIDADISGKTGEGIAWLRAARHILDPSSTTSSTSSSSSTNGKLSALKSSWSSSREDKRLARGASDWGLDAGKFEELRILDWLEKKWVKMNNTVNVQLVPEWRELLNHIPSGRDVHEKKVWRPPTLGEEEVVRLRATTMPGPGATSRDGVADFDDVGISSDEEELDGEGRATGPEGGIVGAYPSTKGEYHDHDHDNSSSHAQAYF